jgi:hypothetical protein
MRKGARAKWDWESVKASYLASQHSTHTIAKIFGIPPNTVASKAKDEGWVAQRKRILIPLQEHLDGQIQGLRDAKQAQIVPNMQKTEPNSEKVANPKAEVIPAEERIKGILPRKDTFRDKIATITDRIADYLVEQSEGVVTMMQADSVASIAEKIEKTGARARGLDRDDEKKAGILINLSVLNGGPELALARSIGPLQLSSTSSELASDPEAS